MRKKFGAGVSDRQIALARRFEAAGLTTYSQAVKAFQNDDQAKIEAWKRQLEEKPRERLSPDDAAELRRVAGEIARLRALLKQPNAE